MPEHDPIPASEPTPEPTSGWAVPDLSEAPGARWLDLVRQRWRGHRSTAPTPVASARGTAPVAGPCIGFIAQVDLHGAGVQALGVRLWDQPRAGGSVRGDDDERADADLARQLSLAAPAFLAWRARDAGRQACRLALRLPAALAQRAGWADELQDRLGPAGLRGDDLQFDLPPALTLDDRNLPQRLGALTALGATLALDDFGTGQSTLSALSRLPLALLKVAPGFAPQPQEPEHHRVLRESTVEQARRLGIATLGKGLRTGWQLKRLRALGIQRGEGAAANALLTPTVLADLPRSMDRV